MSFTDDAEHSETLTSVATEAVAAQPADPLTATFSNMPASHHGSSAFTFDLAFSENVKAGYARIRDDAFNVSGADIIKAQRKAQGSNQSWTITVRPKATPPSASRCLKPQTATPPAPSAPTTNRPCPIPRQLTSQGRNKSRSPTHTHRRPPDPCWPPQPL